MINTKAEQLIRNQDLSKPFFLYFATPVPHASSDGYGDAQYTVPRFQLRPSVFSFTEKFPERKRQLALIQALDDSFMRITEALVNKGIASNTILVFFGDNGGAIPETGGFVRGANHGVNWPLRNGKGSLFEGGTQFSQPISFWFVACSFRIYDSNYAGVRTPSFIWSPLLKKRGFVTNQLFDVIDWLPTLYEAAGGDLKDLSAVRTVCDSSDRQSFILYLLLVFFKEKLDGVSQWKSLQCKHGISIFISTSEY